jgi:hypothetical protein
MSRMFAKLTVEQLYPGMLVEEKMGRGNWQLAKIVRVVKRASKFYPRGHVKVDVIRVTGPGHHDWRVECHDEVPLDKLSRYLRTPQAHLEQPSLPNYQRVDLLNASPHTFCDTLRLAASLGVTDAMVEANDVRSDHELAALLCEVGRYRYEHVRMLHEAYESGRMFVELRGQGTNMSWGTTTDTGWRETEHGRYRVKLTRGKA